MARRPLIGVISKGVIMLPKNIVRKDFTVGDIPMSLLSHDSAHNPKPAIIWYHGWSSSRESQIFRGAILATYGFHVLMPDGKGHGERGELDYEKEIEQLPIVLLQNLKEYETVKEALLDNAQVKDEEIYVAGHSMGAMTAGGLLANHTDIAGAICLNGANDWRIVTEPLRKYKMDELADKVELLDPMNHIDQLNNRKLIMLNGELDDNVNPIFQTNFYKKAKESYEDQDKLIFESVEEVPHVVTTNMLERAIELLLE